MCYTGNAQTYEGQTGIYMRHTRNAEVRKDMETEQMAKTTVNRAILKGEVAAEPVLSHENHGVAYWRFPLSVMRLSGAVDVLNVIASAPLLERCPLSPGMCVEVEGEIRSFNNKSGVGSRLIVSMHARTIGPAEGEHINELELVGSICKPPILRRTPLGREICDLIVAVNRRYSRADYLPCIVWGGLAQRCATLKVGETVRIQGRFQSRGYHKVENGETTERVAYEVSVMKLEREGDAKPPVAVEETPSGEEPREEESAVTKAVQSLEEQSAETQGEEA